MAPQKGQHGNLRTRGPWWKGDWRSAELLLHARAPRADERPVSRWAHVPGTNIRPWKAHLAESDFSISHFQISQGCLSGIRQPLYLKSLFLGAFIIQAMLILVQRISLTELCVI